MIATRCVEPLGECASAEPREAKKRAVSKLCVEHAYFFETSDEGDADVAIGASEGAWGSFPKSRGVLGSS